MAERAPVKRPGPPRAITGRALVLGALVVVLLVVLASPLNRYFGSRTDVGHAAQKLTDDQKQLAILQDQLRKWSDPGYIQQQARQRLLYAMPGDTVYIVVNPGEKSDLQKAQSNAAAKPVGPWNQRLWQSIETAGS